MYVLFSLEKNKYSIGFSDFYCWLVTVYIGDPALSCDYPSSAQDKYRGLKPHFIVIPGATAPYKKYVNTLDEEALFLSEKIHHLLHNRQRGPLIVRTNLEQVVDSKHVCESLWNSLSRFGYVESISPKVISRFPYFVESNAQFVDAFQRDCLDTYVDQSRKNRFYKKKLDIGTNVLASKIEEYCFEINNKD